MAVAWVNNAFDASTATNGTTTSFGFSPANSFVANNTIVFLVENGSVDVSLSSVTDGSNAYTIKNIAVGVDIVYCLKVVSNPTTVTVNYPSAPSTGNSIFIEGDQFSGVVSIDPTLVGVSNSSGVNPVTSGTFTPKTANNMIYGITDCSATTITAGTNVAFTLRSNGSSSGGNTTGISTETFLQSGGPSAVAVTFGDSPASSFSSTVFWIALSPVAQPSTFISDDPRGIPIRRKRQSPLKQQDDWIQKQTLFQTTTPPIGFDEDRGARVRRPPFRAHTTPLEDTWIQKQTLFQTTTPPIGFDEDRGQQARRVPWRAHPQPDYPEQQRVIQFQTFTPPIGFDEDRGRQIRRLWVAHPQPQDDLFQLTAPPIYFDEEQHFQIRRPSWRKRAELDDLVKAPTVFVALGFDEDRGRQIRRPWVAHPQPQEDIFQIFTPPIYFDEEQHFQIRRPSWRQRQAGVDDFIQAPTVFVPLGFDEDRGRQIRRLWVAHPQPQEDLVPTVTPPIYFDEDRGRQIRRLWVAHPQPQDDLSPIVIPPIYFDEEQHFQIRRIGWRAHLQFPDDDWLPIIPFPVSWGFDEEQHFQIRRTSWRQTSAIKREEAGDFTPLPPPPPKAHATGNVIFGVIRNLF